MAENRFGTIMFVRENSGNARAIKNATEKVERGFKRTAREAKRSGDTISSSFKSASQTVELLDGPLGGVAARLNTLSRIFGRLGAVSGAALATLGGGAILANVTQGYQNLQALVRANTDSQNEFSTALQNITTVADNSRASLESTGRFYVRLLQSSDALGLKQAEVARVTGIATKAIALSGASASEAASSITQFAQAISADRLAGDEFKSLSENASLLINVLQEGLTRVLPGFDGTRKQLRELSEDGQLTADIVISALTTMEGRVEEIMGRMPVTIAQASTLLNNAFQNLFGRFDETTGFTNKLATAMVALAENMDLVVQSAALLGGVLVGRLAARALPAVIAAIGGRRGLVTQLRLMERRLIATQVPVRGLSNQLPILTRSLLVTRGAVATLVSSLGGPLGVALTVAGVAAGFLASRKTELERATDRLNDAEQEYATFLAESENSTERLSDAEQRLQDIREKRLQQNITIAAEERFLAASNQLDTGVRFRGSGSRRIGGGRFFDTLDPVARIEASVGSGDLGFNQALERLDALQKKLGNTEEIERSRQVIAGYGESVINLAKSIGVFVESVNRPQSVLSAVALSQKEFGDLVKEAEQSMTEAGRVAAQYSVFLEDIADRQRDGSITVAEARDEIIELTKARDEALAKIKETAQALQEETRAQEAQNKARARARKQLEDQIESLQRENAVRRSTIGLSESQRDVALKMAEAFTVQSAAAGPAGLAGTMVNLIKLYKQLQDEANLNEFYEQLRQVYQRNQQIQQRFSESIYDSFRDAIRGGFEDGFDSAKDFFKRLKNLGLDYLSDVITQSILTSNTAAAKASQQAGQGAASGGLGGGGGLAGTVQSLFGKNSAFQTNFNNVFQGGLNKLQTGLGKVFNGGLGKLGQTISGVAGNALGGAALGGTIGGIQEALGLGDGKFAQIGGAIGSVVGGPIGGLIGSAVGAVAGFVKSIFGSSTRKGGAVIGTGDDGELGIITTVSRKDKGGDRVAAGRDLGDATISALDQIAETLGASLAEGFNIGTIGVRNDQFAFDPNFDGSGSTKNLFSSSALRFDDAEDAISAAVESAIKRGILVGLSETSERLLKNSSDIESALESVQIIESIPLRLQAATDPLGFALDELDKEFASLLRTLEGAQATVSELQDLEALYDIERRDILERSGQSIQQFEDFLFQLRGGTNSAFSASSRRTTAETQLSALESSVADGGSISFGEFQQAANAFLGASRDLNASSSAYFNDVERVENLARFAITDLEATAAETRAQTDEFKRAIKEAQDRADANAAITNDHLANLNEQWRQWFSSGGAYGFGGLGNIDFSQFELTP